MMVEDVLKVIGQYGLPLVLFVVLAIAYDRKEKQHEAARAKWDEERRKMQEERDEERRDWYLQTKADGERLTATLLEAHKNHASIINAANDMATAFTQEKKELREARERELRDTAGRPRLPR